MKRLWLLRHAKAGPYSEDDFGRALAARGRRNAPLMGGKLAAAGCAPELILCSAARRAVETLCGVLPGLPGDCSIEVRRGLYTFSPNELLEHLRELPAETGELMVVGHNPALQELALYLAGSGEEDALAVLYGKFPTCAVAELSFPASGQNTHWHRGAAVLERVMTPRPPRDTARGSIE